MAPFPRIVYLLAGLLWLAVDAPLLSAADGPMPEAKKSAGKFLRLRRDAQGQPVALETATVRFVPASGTGGLVVDLIGVVHVGDRAYYDQLNQQLDQYDVLLYELVAPPGTRIPRGGRRDSDNPLALVQQLMKTVLDLESQTERIDYTRKTFVHADLSPRQMAEAIRKRGDDGLTLFLSIAADLLRQQNLRERQRPQAPARDDPTVDLFSLLLDPDGSVKLKRALAEQFEAAGDLAAGLGGTLNTILVTDRNQAAMQVFQKELAKGKKKIGIFYGAAHMPDFAKRLQEDFGLQRDRVQWLTAWDLKAKKRGGGLEELFKRLAP